MFENTCDPVDEWRLRQAIMTCHSVGARTIDQYRSYLANLDFHVRANRVESTVRAMRVEGIIPGIVQSSSSLRKRRR